MNRALIMKRIEAVIDVFQKNGNPTLSSTAVLRPQIGRERMIFLAIFQLILTSRYRRISVILSFNTMWNCFHASEYSQLVINKC